MSNTPPSPFFYLVVHKGATNRLGVFAMQVAHAAQECLRSAPIADNTAGCAMEAESSADLEVLSAKLTEAGIHHTLCREPDAPWNGTATALCTEPGQITRRHPLLAGFRVLK